MIKNKFIYHLILVLFASSMISCDLLNDLDEEELVVDETPIPDPEPTITDDYKVELMKKYAPYTYMDKDESYFPSSLDYAFPHFKRYLNEDNGLYSLTTIEPLQTGNDILDFFHGEMSTAKVYVFWIAKDESKYQITHFYFYPYNEATGNIVQNHVGDWEHASVRLRWIDKGNEDWVLEPYQMYLATHSTGTTKAWEDVEKIGDQPVVFSAQGSHGMYFTEGQHEIDITSKGEVLDVAENGRIVAFDYSSKKGLNGSDWPKWMSKDFSNAGSNPIDNPLSGPIYRFGNQKMDCQGTVGGEEICTLSDGPTGPINKPVWDPSTYEK
ncbi:Vps62-related protein [Ekhidna sp.]|uniref:Vps62-related protein n=1 Tax=Ekhidna sp. TaxID=2608089 RepID=UPI003CCBBCF8